MGEGDGCEGRVESIIRTKICEIVNSVGQGNFTFVRKMSGKGHRNVRNLWLWQPYTFLVVVFHFEVVTITFFLIVIVLFCLAFSFFVIVFFAFLVERCRNVSQGDDVAAALNWSSELLYSR